jgi:uncharacterized membrane protein (GlpM family)
MDAAFWLKLTLSFIVGSLWVTVTTLSAERFGSKIGGLIGGLPSTVVIALLFIGVTQSAQVAAQATTVMPLAQGVNGLFALAFMLLVKRGLRPALSGSLLVWFLLSTFLYLLDIQEFWISILGWLVLLAFCYWVVERQMKLESKGRLQVSYPPAQIAWRALFGGTVIAWAVFMGKVGGPLLGGIFGSFPAMYLTNLVITSLMGGPEFSRSVGKSLLISGMVNVPLYEMIVRLLYPTIGLGWGTVIALVIISGTGYLTFQFIKTRLA